MLEIQDLHAYLGHLYVVQGVSLRVERGDVLFILGRNGAGKTTLLKTIMGFISPSRGRIFYEGIDITSKPLYERARMGIRYIPDNRRLFPTLTVEENLLVGLSDIHERKKTLDRLEYIYTVFPDLKKLRKLRAKQLSGGQQQMLNIARAIAHPDAKLFLIDEPTEGLSPIYASKIASVIQDLVREDRGVVIVETKPWLMRKIGGMYAIMNNGRIVSQGGVKDLMSSRDLIERYLGVTMS
ncbi:MAG: ABC transporter ATP-binding protein [Sulfolobales archaeon]